MKRKHTGFTLIQLLLAMAIIAIFACLRPTQMVGQARAVARECRLSEQAFVATGRHTVWFPWTGSRIQRTLAALCRDAAGLEVREDEFTLTFEKAQPGEVRAALAGLLTSHPTAMELAAAFPIKTRETYDGYLSEELQTRLFAHNALDLDGALEVIRSAVQ